MTADSTLQAHHGYILQCTNNESYYSSVIFQFKAQNNGNKNNIFASGNEKIALSEYVSEFAHNRSWNLIGNPYPAYFDTRYLDFEAPITIWNSSNQTYNAYSPIDDSFILKPGEAFFVQRPIDQAEIGFLADGRQHDEKVRSIEQTQSRAKTFGGTEREVYNLTLSSNNATDRTRFVINPQAEMSYNPSHDAGKMMSDYTHTAQVYIIGENDGIDYAINERPFGDGTIRIGARFAEGGTYTLALDGERTAILSDRIEGKQVELNSNGYTFTTKAGDSRNRFYLTLKSGTTGIESLEDIDTNRSSAIIDIYTLDGKLVKSTKGKIANANLAAGTYIVKTDGKVHKVQIKP